MAVSISTSFTRYGQEWQNGITLDELLAIQRDTSCLWARVENSGSEGIYLEVARWNMVSHQWQRLAFAKFDNAKDKTPHALAKQINHHGIELRVIHVMPNYQPEQAAWQASQQGCAA